MLLKRRKRYSPTSRKARVFKAPLRCSYKICRRRIVFPTSRLTQERRKISTDKLPTRRVQDSPLSFFCPTSRSIQGKQRIFLPTSYIQGQWKYVKAKEAVESARAGLSHLGESVRKSRKKRKRPRKVRRWLQQRQVSVCPKP
jgi:hypothetical protein